MDDIFGNGNPLPSCARQPSCGYYFSEGEFGWKQLRFGRFAILYIPRGTVCHIEGVFGENIKERRQYLSRKYRAERAYVVGVYDVDYHRITNTIISTPCTIAPVSSGISTWDRAFEYRPDTIIRPWRNLYEMTNDEACAPGIHYYSRPKVDCYMLYSEQAQDLIHMKYEMEADPARIPHLEQRFRELMKL